MSSTCVGQLWLSSLQSAQLKIKIEDNKFSSADKLYGNTHQTVSAMRPKLPESLIDFTVGRTLKEICLWILSGLFLQRVYMLSLYWGSFPSGTLASYYSPKSSCCCFFKCVSVPPCYLSNTRLISKQTVLNEIPQRIYTVLYKKKDPVFYQPNNLHFSFIQNMNAGFPLKGCQSIECKYSKVLETLYNCKELFGICQSVFHYVYVWNLYLKTWAQK